MRALGRVPPGRAGRMWLGRRIETAHRGRDQLDRKLQILGKDHQRMRVLAEEARAEWHTACRAADTWLLRTTLLGGQVAVKSSVAQRLVDLEVTWVSEMGLTYPDTVTLVSDGAADRVVGNAALAPAVTAFRLAVVAGARAAAADEAVRRLERETQLTRRRVRAMDKRWIPWLESALREREILLDQAEQEDSARTRRALIEEPSQSHAGP